jgi:Brp/Blh family beta-carotene 15,15'-monooxygenase
MVSRQKQFDVNPVTWTVEWFHSLGFVIIGSIVLAMAGLGIQINPLDAPLIVAAVILLLGVPHGAFDVAIWCRRNSTAGPLAFAQMLVAYIGLASTFFGLWVFFPQLTLPAFLAISAIHFSDDWESSLAAIPRFVIAVALVASPAVFFYRDVITIFNLLAPSDVSEFAVAAMQFIAAPALSTSAVIVVILALRDPLTALEIVVVLALALLTPPMVFFLIYFCGLHSLRHVIHVHRELQPANISSFLLAAWPYAPLAILGTVIGGVTLSSLPIGHAVLGTVFIALGALTIPHMLLIDRFGAVTPR